MLFQGLASLSKERRAQLAAFQKKADIRFRSLELLNLSFTHRSCGNEDPAKSQNNERLEFLGDAVLGLVAASCLYELLGERSEGELARVKSYVVSEEVLSELAEYRRGRIFPAPHCHRPFCARPGALLW